MYSQTQALLHSLYDFWTCWFVSNRPDGAQEQGVQRFAGVVEMCKRQRCETLDVLFQDNESRIHNIKVLMLGKKSCETLHPLRHQNQAVTGHQCHQSIENQASFSLLLRKLPVSINAVIDSVPYPMGAEGGAADSLSMGGTLLVGFDILANGTFPFAGGFRPFHLHVSSLCWRLPCNSNCTVLH